ncbi:MAG TPA: hypothetical protein VEY51_08535, partial [Chondromyces sp.]|nr:hypothetical protein [Chondromyces sp.]
MVYLFTHNDLDGVSCGILAKLAYGENAEISYNSVGSLDHQVRRHLEKGEKEGRVIITDLSIHSENEQLMDKFVEGGGEAYLIDHHKSALHLNDHSWGQVTVEKDGVLTSATSLFYEFLLTKGEIEKNQTIDEY